MASHVQETALSMPDPKIEAAYKQAVERAISRIPVKNGVINIDSIWVETSIPYEILHQVLKAEDLVLPDNVERINARSGVRDPESVPQPVSGPDGERRTAKRRKRRSKSRSKAKAGD